MFVAEVGTGAPSRALPLTRLSKRSNLDFLYDFDLCLAKSYRDFRKGPEDEKIIPAALAIFRADAPELNVSLCIALAMSRDNKTFS